MDISTIGSFKTRSEESARGTDPVIRMAGVLCYAESVYLNIPVPV